MFISLPIKRTQMSINSIIYLELFNIYGFSFYKYFLFIKNCGFFNLNKITFKIISEANLLACFNFFLLTNFVFSNKLKNYKRGRCMKYLSFFNYKKVRIISGLPIRGQRTQTNARTMKKIGYV